MIARLDVAGDRVGAVGCFRQLWSATLIRRATLALWVMLVAGLNGCSDRATASTYTGVWKSSCGNYWGMRIVSAAGSLYAVTFCGLSGCMEPGEWLPDTHFDGDPRYQLVSESAIRIKRKDGRGYFTYVKCSADPGWEPGAG